MSEHDTFYQLTESLTKAAEAAAQLALYRPDQGHGWNKIAELLTTVRDRAHELAMSRVGQ